MNKKTLSVVISVSVLLLLVILNFTLFRVKNVKVQFKNDAAQVHSEDVTEDYVISKSGIKKGKSIFGISQSKVKANIDNAIYSVELLHIERKFPNTIILHVERRVPILWIRTATSPARYLILDKDLKVLDEVSDINNIDSSLVKVVPGQAIKNTQATKGDTLENRSGSDDLLLVNRVIAGLLISSKNDKNEGAIRTIETVKRMLKSIDIVKEKGKYTVVLRVKDTTNNNGCKYEIGNFAATKDNLATLQYAVEKMYIHYTELSDAEVNDDSITFYYDDKAKEFKKRE